MRRSEVHKLDPSDVFGALALQSPSRTSPTTVRGSPRKHSVASAEHSVLVGQAPTTRHLLRLMDKLGKCRWPVLLLGEPGTGKEVVARAIYNTNPIGQFVVIDCHSIVGSRMESELFGYVKGAFAGALAAKTGFIESANGGTAFFNGIDAIPLDLQAKLLCVLQDKAFHPVGSRSTRRSDFRMIAATNRDLAEEVEKGEFRRDLFYRLNVVNLRLAPLRERKEDIAALLNHFSVKLGGNHAVAGDAMKAMLSYDWPGNLRELEDCIRHAMAVSTGRFIHAGDLPADVQNFIGEREKARPSAVSLAGEKGRPPDRSKIERGNPQVPKSLWAHALKTFGSASLATEWFLAECGALDNRAPIDSITREDGTREVDRILGCIDYGMIA